MVFGLILTWIFSRIFSHPNHLRVFLHQIFSTLLELGASPNYKDARGLTPLYLSVIKKTDAKICESLLHDHATLGTQDSQGWQEVHQVRSFYSSLLILKLYLKKSFHFAKTTQKIRKFNKIEEKHTTDTNSWWQWNTWILFFL